MRKKRSLVQLLLLLLRLGLQEAVVRLTLRICVGALCKASAATLVETLFIHHAWTLAVFTGLLDASLLFFCAGVVLELFDELDIPVRDWLKALYGHLMPRGGEDNSRQLPEARPEVLKAHSTPQKTLAPKTPVLKRRKNAKNIKNASRRRPAKSTPHSNRLAEAAIHTSQPPAAEPQTAPRLDDDRGLEG